MYRELYKIVVSKNIPSRKTELSKFLKKNIELIQPLRKEVEVSEKIGEISMEKLMDSVSIVDVPSVLKMALEKYPRKAYIVVEPYGYDGGVDYSIYRKLYKVETDKQLIDRLSTEIIPVLKEIYKTRDTQIKTVQIEEIIDFVLSRL